MKNETALLLIDIQNDYFEGGANPLSGSLEASMKAKEVLHYFRHNSLPVVHIQHVANRSDATFFAPDTFGVEIQNNVKPVEGEMVLVKHFPNSFWETGLHNYLQTLSVKNLVVCGMMTHMCVDATVRAAKDLGYACTLLADACATKDLIYGFEKVCAKDVQITFYAALSYFYADVISAQECICRHYS